MSLNFSFSWRASYQVMPTTPSLFTAIEGVRTYGRRPDETLTRTGFDQVSPRSAERWSRISSKRCVLQSQYRRSRVGPLDESTASDGNPRPHASEIIMGAANVFPLSRETAIQERPGSSQTGPSGPGRW